MNGCTRLHQPAFCADLSGYQWSGYKPLEPGATLLERWLAWASRSQIPAFVKLARTIREHKVRIYAAIVNKLTNARVEQVNTRIRLMTRVAFGFHSPAPLIALAMLTLGGLCPPLPGRPHDPHIDQYSLKKGAPEVVVGR